jgi:hypothetical protein
VPSLRLGVGDYDNYCRLGCDTVKSGNNIFEENVELISRVEAFATY